MINSCTTIVQMIAKQNNYVVPPSPVFLYSDFASAIIKEIDSKYLFASCT